MAISKKKLVARTFFLGVTALAIGTECWFAWDGDPETDPWTDLIGDYVPWQLALAVFGALLFWVPAHFWVRYKREAAEQAAKKQAARDALAVEASAHNRTKAALDRANSLLADEGIGEEQPPGQGTLF